MRTVFRFEKGGTARYISHLDLMRTMNRAIHRAGLPASYSQGFHPHITMAYAQALGLGYLSSGEYMEISLADGCDPAGAVDALNGVLPAGIRMTGAWPLDDAFPTLMAAVTAALWRVEFAGGIDDVRLAAFRSLMERDSVMVLKEGKNGSAQADIRKGLLGMERAESGIELFLAAGSALNIRPELVVKAALGSVEAIKTIARLELYTSVNERHVPFYKICIGGEQAEHGKDHTG